MHVCGTSVGLMPADPPMRGPPPPIPSYRQHVEARDEPMYVEVSPSKDSDSGDRTLTNNQSNMTPPPVTHYDTPVAPPRRKTFSGSIPRSPETSASTAREVGGKLADSHAFTPAREQGGRKHVQVHTCAHTHTHTHTHTRTHTHTHTHTHAYMHVHSTHTMTHTYILTTHVCTQIYAQPYAHTCTQIFMDLHTQLTCKPFTDHTHWGQPHESPYFSDSLCVVNACLYQHLQQ